jgi:hypothetical protein
MPVMAVYRRLVPMGMWDTGASAVFLNLELMPLGNTGRLAVITPLVRVFHVPFP